VPVSFDDAGPDGEMARTLRRVHDRHRPTLVTVAKALLELRALTGSAGSKFPDLRPLLDDFYVARVGLRMLIGQFLALHDAPPSPSYVGLIDTECSPAAVARAAVEDAAFVCRREYGEAPDVVVEGRTDLVFPYVPSHLFYILLELLKNSMKAVVETHGDVDGDGDADDAFDLPRVRIVIADGEDNEDVVIKVADEGGGIKRRHLPRVWNYLFTTSSDDWASALEDGAFDAAAGPFTRETPLSGLGYGLPISRVYAKYFGGDLDIVSMEGFGTDAYLHLSRLGDHDEPLP
jgi:pyruvate dehydrogenase kinase 2/3/4